VSGILINPLSIDILLYSAVITTSAVAGNRSLGIIISANTPAASSKVVAPSTTGDLLDRPVVFAKNTGIRILGWDNTAIIGDLMSYTYTRLI
jgi:hypothetical protein